MRHINDLDYTTKLESRYLALSKVFDVYIHIPLFVMLTALFAIFIKKLFLVLKLTILKMYTLQQY